MELISHSENQTLEIGRRIGRALKPPCVVLLQGDLGSGKTVLVKGIVQGLGADAAALVHSPSFSLVNQYPGGPCPIFHLDLYRLETPREIYSIGIEDILAEDGIVLVEWAERLSIPTPGSLTIAISTDNDPNWRRIVLQPDLPLE